MKQKFDNLEQGDVFLYNYHYAKDEKFCTLFAVVVANSDELVFRELIELQGSGSYRIGCEKGTIQISVYEYDDDFKFGKFMFSSDYDEGIYDDDELYVEHDAEILKQDILGRYPEYFI